MNMDKTALEGTLSNPSDRLRARTAEYRKSGKLSIGHQALLTEIQRRSDALRKRVDEAAAACSTWQLVKAEAAKGFSSLYDELLQLEERHESEGMKKR